MKKKLTKKSVELSEEEQFWDQVEENSKWKVYEILTQNIPLQNVKLIEDNWNVGGVKKVEEISKKVGLFPDRDTDYRVILRDDVPNYLQDNEEFQTKIINGNWDYEDVNYAAQLVSFWYSIAIIKGMVRSLSAYDCYDPSYFENLTTNEY